MISCARRVALAAGGLLSSSVRSRCARVSAGTNVAPTGGGRKVIVEKLWRELFSDPSQWWDNRAEKVNSRYPDFKHKKTQQSLWLDSNLTPPWVEVELAAMAPGTLQSDIFSWNIRLLRSAKAGNYKKTMELFQELQQEGMDPDKFTFIPILNACARLGALVEGRRIHTQIIQNGHESDMYVASSLVDMYAKCGSVEDAWRVFNNMPLRNIASWNAMILGYVKCGEAQKALELSGEIYRDGMEPNSGTFVGMLNACASLGALAEGRVVHEQLGRSGYESNNFVASSLINMYAKCGSMEDAERVFKRMRSLDVVSWTTMILGYVRYGQGWKALELSRQMCAQGVEPDSTTFMGMLNACASVAALEEGRLVHEQVCRKGYESDVFVGSSIVNMYAKCGSIEDAQRVFNRMPSHDLVSWTTMILGYVKCGQAMKALELSQQMHAEGVEPDPTTFVGLLNACASIATIEEGRLVHEKIIQRGYEFDVFVGNSLIDMYAKCGSIEEAQRLFNKMPSHTLVSWNSMILGYVKCGEEQKAIELFWQMNVECVEPSSVTFIIVLNACSNIAALEEGRLVHEQVSRKGCESNMLVASSLVDMYAKSGSIEDAQWVFHQMRTKDLVSWNTMLAGYAMHGWTKEALEHFGSMSLEDVEVDGVTFVGLLWACSHGGLVEEGLHYFNSMVEIYNISPRLEHYACVIDLLGRAGHLHQAEDLIRSLPCEPDATVWMSLLGACRIHRNVEMGKLVPRWVLGIGD